jgi:hypothetical protein
MSIVNELKRIENNIANAYTALGEKGAELPQEQNSNNLASTINSIQAGGGSEFADILFKTGLPAKLVVPSNYTKIRDYALYAPDYTWDAILEEITGENVEELGEYALYGQTSLKKINFPKVKRIGAYCFRRDGINPVETVNFGALEYVGNYALYRLFNDTNVKVNFSIAEGCEIGNYAFSYGSLSSFDFSNVKSIGSSCLSNAVQKMKVWLPSTVETISCGSGSTMFQSSNKGHTIYTDVPNADSVPSGWGDYWYKSNSSTAQNVVYGATYEDYANAEV